MSIQVNQVLMSGLLLSGLSMPWHAHADAAASSVLSDLRFFAVDLDLSDGIDPAYTLDGDLSGHVYVAAGDAFNAYKVQDTLQGDVPLELSTGIGMPAASANATASVVPGQLSVSASASGNSYHIASGQASLGSAKPGNEFRVGIDLSPRSMLSISFLASVSASAGGLAACPNVSTDASMFCESQGASGLVSASINYSYQSGALNVTSSQFDMVSKGVLLTPIYDFAPEELGFYLQIVDPAPDESVADARRMYFTFSNTSSEYQHADLRLFASASAGGGIPSVPEPSAMACLALGLSLVGFRFRRAKA